MSHRPDDVATDPLKAYISFVRRFIPIGALVAALGILGIVLGFLPPDVGGGLISTGGVMAVVALVVLPRLKRNLPRLEQRRNESRSHEGDR